MYRMLKTTWAAVILLITLQQVKGQNALHFSIADGLPSNHIYDITVDRNHYLWACTPEGVARFNGYEWKIFNISSGLATNDVWGLTEDNSGRMWLWTIYNELGYIANEKYHKVSRIDSKSVIYPRDIRKYKNGIVFYKIAQKQFSPVICVVQGDSLVEISLPSEVMINNQKIILSDSVNQPIISISASAHIYIITNRHIVKSKVSGNKIAFESAIAIDDSVYRHLSRGTHFIVNNLIINSDQFINKGSFTVTSTLDGETRTTYLPGNSYNNEILSVYTQRNSIDDSFVYITTRNEIFKYSIGKKITLEQRWNKNELLDGKNEQFSIDVVLDNNYWGKCIGTRKNGVFVVRPDINVMHPLKQLDLHNFSFKGKADSAYTFWWNKELRKLLALDASYKIKWNIATLTADVNAVLPYNGDTALICLAGSQNNYWLNMKTGGVSVVKDLPSHIFSGVKVKSMYYFISMRGVWVKNLCSGDLRKIDDNRYSGIAYNKHDNAVWVYNAFSLLSYPCNNSFTAMEIDYKKWGVKALQKVYCDSILRQIFIKDVDKIIKVEQASGKVTNMFPQYNLSGAAMIVDYNRMIVVNKSAIFVVPIPSSDGRGHKNMYYSIQGAGIHSLSDIAIQKNQITLNTDKGAFSGILSASQAISSNIDNDLVIKSSNEQITFHNNDTLTLDQKSPTFLLDKVSVCASGKLKFVYRVDGCDTGYKQAVSGEVYFTPALIPGKYYKLRVVASDDTFVFPESTIILFVKPYWWQTVTNHPLFVLLIGLMLIGLLAITVAITKKVVNRRNMKRTLTMELELKSIYAQINPHFIFNTLSGVMYLIKKEQLGQAYNHVAKFSKLLRAYLHSSRKRYTPLSVELENLENYIQLQQMRFDNKFAYKIDTSEEIDSQDIMIPSLLIQPFVENAINHGLFHLEHAGSLTISFKYGSNKKQLICIIEDNGIGREASRKIYREGAIKRESYGDTIITDLVSILNRYENSNIKIEYQDKPQNNSGTRVIIALEIKKP